MDLVKEKPSEIVKEIHQTNKAELLQALRADAEKRRARCMDKINAALAEEKMALSPWMKWTNQGQQLGVDVVPTE